MIKIGIIGMGNVAWNVHLPVLLSRNDIKVCWVCDKDLNKEYVLNKKEIPSFDKLEKAINFEKCDIALLTAPYSEREKIFEQIKNLFKGIYFEKPFALTTKQHQYYSDNFKDYEITIGYQRRHMGTVKTIRNIINQNLFGHLISIKINFGDVYYKFDGFRSEKKKSGGGIFFESGSHWIDTVLFTTSAKDIKNFNLKKKEENNLDIQSEGSFTIIDKKNHEFNCDFYMTILENTSNTIEYNFQNCSINLTLFDDDSQLRIINSDNNYIIKDDEFSIFPSKSLDVASSFWNYYLDCYKNRKNSDISASNFILTTKIIELFYAK